MAAGIQLPPLVQRIVLDPTGVGAAATKVQKQLNPVSKAATNTARSVGHMSTSLNTLSFRAQTTGRLLFRNLGMPLALVGGMALKSFLDFEKSMVKIEALVGISSGAVANFTERVKEVAEVTGRGPQELADAMFFVSSAGLRGAVAMEVMEASAKGAAIGLGQTSVVADAATSAVNAYGSENLSGAAAVDVLTAAVREGKVEATRLTPAIGKAIPVASAMGIEFHEIAAAIAAMTRTGTDARTSAIQLRQIMQSILDPSRQTTRALKEFGIAEGELADIARNKGLLAVLVKIRDLSKENAEAFADIFPNVRALAGALDITGENLQENTEIFRQLANSAGDTDDAFQAVAKTGAHRLKVAVAGLQVSFTEFGEALTPLVGVTAGFLRNLSKVFKMMSNNAALVGIVGGFSILGIVMGLALIAAGRLTQAYIFLQAALTGVSKKAKVAAGAIRLLTIASGVGVFLALAAGLGAMTASMFGFGREADKTSKTLANLREELRDIRTAGKFAITPITGLTKAVTELKEASEEMQLAQAFDTSFMDNILQAFKAGVGTLAGGLEAEDAITTFFFGRGDTPAVRKALAKIIDDMNREVGDSSDVFLRHFGPAGTDRIEAITNFLLGNEEGVRKAVAVRAQIHADTLVEALDDVLEAGFERVRRDAPAIKMFGEWSSLDDLMDSGLIDEDALRKWLIDGERDFAKLMGDHQFTLSQRGDKSVFKEWIERAAGDSQEAIDAMTPVAKEMERLIKKGNVVEFTSMWSDMIEDVIGSDEVGGKATQAGINNMKALDGLFAQTMLTVTRFGEVDSFDMTTNSFDGLMRAIVAAMEAEGREWKVINAQLENFAQTYVKQLQGMRHASGDAGEATLNYADIMSDATLRGELFAEMSKEVNRQLAEMAANTERASITVKTMFEDLEVAFSGADAAAKRMNKRFDDLIGRAMGVGEAQDAFNSGLRDMVETLAEGDGTLNSSTKAGIENREALRSQVDAALAYSEAITKAGGSAKEAQAAFTDALGSIAINALDRGTNAKELDKFFADNMITEERIGMMFMDQENALVPDALRDQIEGIAAGTRSMMGPLYHGIGEHINDSMAGGISESASVVQDAIETAMKLGITVAYDTTESRSPSKVFYKLGQSTIDGYVDGVWDGIPKVTNAYREMVEHAISTTNQTIGKFTGAISSVLDLERAQKALRDIRRDRGGVGIDTDFEKLTRAKLKRDVKSAERALRMGEGHIEDLELALRSANIALESFDEAAASGDELKRAELAAVEAGLKFVDANAQMKMESEDAQEAFKSMATSVGLSETAIESLLGVTADEDSFFETLISAEVLEKINQVRDGLGEVKDKADEIFDPVDGGIGDRDMEGLGGYFERVRQDPMAAAFQRRAAAGGLARVNVQGLTPLAVDPATMGADLSQIPVAPMAGGGNVFNEGASDNSFKNEGMIVGNLVLTKDGAVSLDNIVEFDSGQSLINSILDSAPITHDPKYGPTR
tara:strand:+ start:4993 stop:9441 length:4449 start_codon:yes stop_codon:yes gene_type:complete